MTNNNSDSRQCAAIGEELSGLLDGELTQQQSQRVQVHLDSCEACRRLLADLRNMKQQLRQLSYPVSDEAMLLALEKDLVASGAMTLGWIFLMIGAAVAVVAGTIGLFMFFAAPDVPILVKLFNGLLVLGGIALFVSVARQRLLTYKKDKYRQVKL
ncbi:MAG: hypothetical protein RLZZ227_2322 [Pseudomonadota bacterium]